MTLQETLIGAAIIATILASSLAYVIFRGAPVEDFADQQTDWEGLPSPTDDRR